MSTGVNITALQIGNTFEFSGADDWNGSETFTASVTDGELSDSQVFTVTVNPVNDAPVLTVDSTYSFDEDTTGSLTFSTSDVDGDAVTTSISECAVNPNVSASISGNIISFVPLVDYNGSGCFTLTVNDGTVDESGDINITINPVNDSPVISSTPTTSFSASDGYSYTMVVTDVDGDDLTYSLGSSTTGITLIDNVVSWTDIPSDVYAGSFIVNVSDGTITLTQSAELEVVQFVDCAGVNNGSATADCAGTCNGSAYTDQCGSCVTEADPSCVQDCAGAVSYTHLRAHET